MFYIKLIMFPLIGTLIGWWTNIFAIKLIFRPHKPIKLPVLGICFQGLIPKRRYEIAKSIGEALEQEILSTDDIVDKLISEKTKRQLILYIKNSVANKVFNKLPDILPIALKESISNYLETVVEKHVKELFDDSQGILVEKVQREIDLKQMVEDKINSFDIEYLEQIIIKLAKSELRQIELLGGVIGFFIGLIQAFLYYIFSG